eukprot:gene9477-biopygen19733
MDGGAGSIEAQPASDELTPARRPPSPPTSSAYVQLTARSNWGSGPTIVKPQHNWPFRQNRRQFFLLFTTSTITQRCWVSSPKSYAVSLVRLQG